MRHLPGKYNFIIWVVLGLVVIGYAAFVYILPVAAIKGTSVSSSISATKLTAISWPSTGQAALGASGYGVLAVNGSQVAVPTASIAKVVTVLAVLKQMPINAGEAGPTITLTSQDVAIYQKYVSLGGSVVKVLAGEQISEYQAIEALLVASANNIADSLAIWAFGSLDAYVAYANNLVGTYGLTKTHIADASGFSASTVSTASDLVSLGEVALTNPIIVQAIQERQATLPVAGTVKNTNALLGQNGIIGIKTGNTDQAGGCYLFASRYDSGQGHLVTIVGAVLAAANLGAAESSALSMLVSAQANFTYQVVMPAGETVGFYNQAWGAKVPAVTKKALSAVVWKGTIISPEVILQPVKPPISAGSASGTANFLVGNTRLSVPIILGQNITRPSWSWRLFRKN